MRDKSINKVFDSLRLHLCPEQKTKIVLVPFVVLIFDALLQVEIDGGPVTRLDSLTCCYRSRLQLTKQLLDSIYEFVQDGIQKRDIPFSQRTAETKRKRSEKTANGLLDHFWVTTVILHSPKSRHVPVLNLNQAEHPSSVWRH